MKKILGVALVLALTLGAVSGASATDIKLKGYFDFAFGWYSDAKIYDARGNGGEGQGAGSRRGDGAANGLQCGTTIHVGHSSKRC